MICLVKNKHLSSKKSISYKDSLRLIKNEVDAFQSRLSNTDSIEVEKLGVFKVSDEKAQIFAHWRNVTLQSTATAIYWVIKLVWKQKKLQLYEKWMRKI